MPKAKPAFVIDAWYSSEQAKRQLGSLCQAINEQGETTTLMGTEAKPLLVLEDAELVVANTDEIEISIDDAKANWSNVTAAALLYGTRFRIVGKRVVRAVLSSHPEHRHPATKYRRSSDQNLTAVVRKMEQLLEEVRSLFEGISVSAELIDRRFREAWRSNNLPPIGVAAHH